MASKVDICNLALSHVGDEASVVSIDPPDGSTQASHCARFYPIARDTLLCMHAWSFATRREVLASLTLPSTVTSWGYAYALPNQFLDVVAVLPYLAGDDFNLGQGVPYLVEAGDDGQPYLLTNEPQASIRFIRRSEDPTVYTPLFVDALGWLLGAYIAGPIVKGDAGAKAARDCQAAFKGVLAQATAADGNRNASRPEHVPAHLLARR